VFCFACPLLVYGGVQQLLWCVFLETKQNTPQ
jgi:hypothetical protein